MRVEYGRRTGRSAKDFEDLEELIFLERNVLLRVQFCLFALEDWTEACELGHDAAYCPDVDGLVVVFGTEQELGCAVPDGDDDFVPSEERLERLVRQASETQVSDLDDAARGDENVGRFEIAVDDVGIVEVEKAVEELVGQRLENGRVDTIPYGLGVVMNDLLQVGGGITFVCTWMRDGVGRTRKSCSAYSKTM